MDWKNFFWATKEKTLVTIGLFVLLNLIVFPAQITECNKNLSGQCMQSMEFANILQVFSGPYTGVDLSYEIVYIGFSFLATCLVFYKMKKGDK